MPKANRTKRRSGGTKRGSNGTRRRSRSSPRQGATREQIDTYYLAKAHRTLKGRPLAKYVNKVRKSRRKSK